MLLYNEGARELRQWCHPPLNLTHLQYPSCAVSNHSCDCRAHNSKRTAHWIVCTMLAFSWEDTGWVAAPNMCAQYTDLLGSCMSQSHHGLVKHDLKPIMLECYVLPLFMAVGCQSSFRGHSSCWCILRTEWIDLQLLGSNCKNAWIQLIKTDTNKLRVRQEGKAWSLLEHDRGKPPPEMFFLLGTLKNTWEGGITMAQLFAVWPSWAQTEGERLLLLKICGSMSLEGRGGKGREGKERARHEKEHVPHIFNPMFFFKKKISRFVRVLLTICNYIAVWTEAMIKHPKPHKQTAS